MLKVVGGCFVAAILQGTGVSAADVVISQVYTAGGNLNAVYQNDFVELHNRGNTPVSLSGWTLQYATTNTWAVVALLKSSGDAPQGAPAGAPTATDTSAAAAQPSATAAASQAPAATAATPSASASAAPSAAEATPAGDGSKGPPRKGHLPPPTAKPELSAPPPPVTAAKPPKPASTGDDLSNPYK